MLFYEVRHFSPKGGLLYVKVCLWIFLLVKKQYMKKNQALSAKKKMSKSVSGYSKNKKIPKKIAWTTKPLGWGKTLLFRPLKSTFFYACLPLSYLNSLSRMS